ncbi:hypothetical protein MAM1_0967d11390, partial [Mucor ambiguus]
MMLSLGARCCCDYRSLVVLAMLSLGNLVLFAAAVAVYLLSWCRYLALAAAGVVIWNFWFVLCCVDVPIAEAQHYFIRGWG